MQTTSYRQIGQVVYKLQPTLAKQLEQLIALPKPLLTDTSLLQKLFLEFCKHKGTTLDEIMGAGKGKNSIHLKHVFIACIVKLYNPELLTGFHYTDYLKKQLRKELSLTLGCVPNWISQVLPIVIMHLKVYEDFEEEVNESVEFLKGGV